MPYLETTFEFFGKLDVLELSLCSRIGLGSWAHCMHLSEAKQYVIEPLTMLGSYCQPRLHAVFGTHLITSSLLDSPTTRYSDSSKGD